MDVNINVYEIIGQQQVEIVALRTAITAANARIAELEAQPEEVDE